MMPATQRPPSEPATTKDEVVLAVDGASSGNPGPSGWAALLIFNGQHRELSGGVPYSTNNQMELLAVLEGLVALRRPSRVRILTDSQNVIGWLSLGWKRQDPKVRALAERIDTTARDGGHALQFEKVPAHAGHPLNERVNYLAQRRALEQRRSMDNRGSAKI